MIENLRIGILGGGQLGKMLVQSALDLDLNISILENDESCPCRNICSSFIYGDINDYETVVEFGKKLDLITIEIENVNIEALKYLEKSGVKVYPQPHILENIKNKATQKLFFRSNNIPSSEYIEVKNAADILKNKTFLPAINKVAVGGYDGKGVKKIKDEQEISEAFDAPGILEKIVDFKKELAIIVSRNEKGQINCFPCVEMVFHPEANLVEYLFSPAHISKEIEENAIKIAHNVANAYGIVGLLAVEMFLDQDDNILVNEVAPRPHNSGHHTMRANLSSQFDQHWRAILGLALSDTSAIGTAAMVNILGAEGHTGDVQINGLDKILEKGNIYPYFYGKKTTKPFRKMGHVTILENNYEILKEKVKFVQANLIISSK